MPNKAPVMNQGHTSDLSRRQTKPQPKPTGNALRASLAVSRTGTHEDAGRELMRAALGFQEVKIDIPPDAKLGDVEKYLSIAIQGAKRLQDATERIRPMIGKLLYAIRERKLFKPGFKNFTEYIKTRVSGEWGFSKSLAFACLSQVNAFPNLDHSKYESSKLLLAAQVTDESQPNYMEILETLSRATVEEGKEIIKKMKEESTGDTPSEVTLSIRVMPDVLARWNDAKEAYGLSGGDLLTACLDLYVETNAPVEA